MAQHFSVLYIGESVYPNTPIEELRKFLIVTLKDDFTGNTINVSNYTISGDLSVFDDDGYATLTVTFSICTSTVKIGIKPFDDEYKKAQYSQRIKNHTRITVTTKRTGEVITLLETDRTKSDYFAGDLYREEGDEYKSGTILAGIPIKQAVDESLDSLTFIVQETDTKALYKPFDVVNFSVRSKITENGETVEEVDEYEMCVLSDYAVTLSGMHNNYKHTVTCIELTKILEKCKIFNLNLTNPNDTLLKQVEKAIINAEPLIDGRECRYKITDELKALLGSRPGEDFYFSNTELRSVLDGLLAPCNARAEVKHIEFENKNIKTIEIGYRSLTEVKEVKPIWDEEHAGALCKEELSNYAQDYAGKIVSRGYNTLTREPVTFTDTFKADAANIDSTNATVFFPFPISDKGIEKFIVHGRVSYDVKWAEYNMNTGIANGNTFENDIIVNAPFDISKSLLPYEQYELLSDREKENYFPYNIGLSSVGLSGTVKNGIWWTKDKFENILNSGEALITQSELYLALQKEIKQRFYPNSDHLMADIREITLNGPASNTKWFNTKFTITFYPQVNTVTELSKPGVYDKDELLLGITDNQSENTLDVTRHGNRLKSLIKRTGNNEYYIDAHAYHFSRLLPLMSKIKMPADKTGWTDGEYVIYKRECACYDMFVKCRYYLSKDFNAIQKLAGVNRTKHLYDIPLESDECPIVIKKYLVFSTEKDNTQDINAIAKTSLRVLTGETSDDKISSILFKSFCGDTQFPSTDNKWFTCPNVAYAQSTTMNFIAAPLDNYSAGYSRGGYKFSIWGDAGYKVTYNAYVSNNTQTVGECDKFQIQLSTGYKDSLTDAEIEKFPVVNGGSVNTISDICEVLYNKDRTQKPVFLYSLECVPAEQDYGKLIIGSAFCRYNSLVRNDSGEKLCIKISNTQKLFDGQDVLPLNYADYICDWDNIISVTDNHINVSVTGGISIQGSWAIVNENDEILLACNESCRSIYVYLKDFLK